MVTRAYTCGKALPDGPFEWLIVESKTGEIVMRTDAITGGSLEYYAGLEKTAQLLAPFTYVGSDMTTPMRYSLVLLVNGSPLWGGIIVKREHTGGDAGWTLTVSTFEHYLTRVYIKPQTFKQKYQTYIAAQLLKSAQEGWPTLVVSRHDTTGIKRDRTYPDGEDKTVYEVLDLLAGVENGIEWRCSWVVNESKGIAYPRVDIYDSMLNSPGTAPAWYFTDKDIASVKMTQDLSSGYFATRAMAVSNQGGEDMRLTSGWWTPVRDGGIIAGQSPRVDYIFTPSTSIADQGTLREHAIEMINVLSHGVFQADLSLSWDPHRFTELDRIFGQYVDAYWHEYAGPMNTLSEQGVRGRVAGWKLNMSGAWTIDLVLLDTVELVGGFIVDW